jgi:hypothetical protein
MKTHDKAKQAYAAHQRRRLEQKLIEAARALRDRLEDADPGFALDYIEAVCASVDALDALEEK